ncbi:DUF3305 domain-containing protein [Alphaproteobacteria bacterium GH1-50]|uniref:DUF3305 domain-containing protein n=1 Tax=Kangsaoukella pontilimi TaxID=2691042 RepID=A0A7C9MHR4_9RHOB|nr:DUF3305 domain-containing protein [Kangsaoukella pontilimi]MXQ06335.1 DUF3305 domain-containing protein [Kangsaoukella pontilimi]
MSKTTDIASKEIVIPLGVVLRRSPGVTRWAKWAWKAVALIPGATEAGWRVLREENGHTEYLAAVARLELHATEVGSYRTSLMMTPPSIFVVLDKGAHVENEHGVDVHVVTASADIAGDYTDSAEVLVEPVAMPDALVAMIRDFCEAHYRETEFKKRRRDRARVDLTQDGKGDPRIRQESDVYRAPAGLKPGASK